MDQRELGLLTASQIAPESIEPVKLEVTARVDLLDFVIEEKIMDHVLLDAVAIQPGQPGDQRLEGARKLLLDPTSVDAIRMKAGRFHWRGLVDVERRQKDIDRRYENRPLRADRAKRFHELLHPAPMAGRIAVGDPLFRAHTGTDEEIEGFPNDRVDRSGVVGRVEAGLPKQIRTNEAGVPDQAAAAFDSRTGHRSKATSDGRTGGPGL